MKYVHNKNETPLVNKYDYGEQSKDSQDTLLLDILLCFVHG